MTDFELMGAALEEARKAAALGEVPVGAVVAKDGEIISAAHNTRETEKNALHHAELLAIDAACKKLGGWRLWQCELFVTLEPCPMCSGAIINSRIKRVVYGLSLIHISWLCESAGIAVCPRGGAAGVSGGRPPSRGPRCGCPQPAQGAGHPDDGTGAGRRSPPPA